MGIKLIMSSVLFIQICLILILQKLHPVVPTIDVIDHFGRKVDSFQDREATFENDFIPVEGYIITSAPQDACHPILPPRFMTNFTMGKFVLINGTETCGFSKKVAYAQEAGFDLAVIFDPFPMPFEYMHVVPYPRLEINIQVIFVSYMDGVSIRENYLYNNSYAYNFKLRIRPNTPDITYYMYLFGAVIGVCFFVMLLFLMCLLLKCIQERRRRRRNRLSSRQIKQIPTTKFTKGDQYDICAICLEDYKEGEKLRLLPCSHAYHAKCIDPWLMNNRRNCPLCKRKITFGDSADDSASDDSELTSPAENTPLLTSPAHRSQSWGTFAINPVHSPSSDGSGPSSLPTYCPYLNQLAIPQGGSSPESSPPNVSSDDLESLLPIPQHSVNHDASNEAVAVRVNLAVGNCHENTDVNGHRGLIV